MAWDFLDLLAAGLLATFLEVVAFAIHRSQGISQSHFMISTSWKNGVGRPV
jgi:hypothetical protein